MHCMRLKHMFLIAVALPLSVLAFSSSLWMVGRLITSFTAADPFEDDGMEWVRLTVMGQSFVMHQIRKMVRFWSCVVAAVDFGVCLLVFLTSVCVWPFFGGNFYSSSI